MHNYLSKGRMKRILAIILGAFIYFSHDSFAVDSKYRDLFDCAQKMFTENREPFIDNTHPMEFLNDDLLYIKDNRKDLLFILTPDFASKTSLAGIYNFRVPYQSRVLSRSRGFYYFENGQNPRFLTGEAQETPDFSKIAKVSNGITILSINGQDQFAKSTVKYYPLNIEKKIWEENAQNIDSPEINDLLISIITSRTNHMPSQMTKKPMGAGHLGEGWIPSDEMIAYNNKLRQEAINSCSSVALKYNLELFPPKNPSNTTEKIKLSVNTTPAGAWCRCTGEEIWDHDNGWPGKDNVFIVNKTPGVLQLPKGKYKSVICRCVLQDQENMCRVTSFPVSYDISGNITQDIIKNHPFPAYENNPNSIVTGDCRKVDSVRCNVDSDCFNNGFSFCYRKDMQWMWSGTKQDYSPAQRNNSKGCECLKGQCQMKHDVDAKTITYARTLGNQSRIPSYPVIQKNYSLNRHYFNHCDDSKFTKVKKGMSRNETMNLVGGKWYLPFETVRGGFSFALDDSKSNFYVFPGWMPSTSFPCDFFVSANNILYVRYDFNNKVDALAIYPLNKSMSPAV